MEPAIAQALATLIGALTTAVLMASAYYWGPRQRDRREDARRREDRALEDDARYSDRESADSDRRSRHRNIQTEEQLEEDENEQSIE